jgi:hypothetical protein
VSARARGGIALAVIALVTACSSSSGQHAASSGCALGLSVQECSVFGPDVVPQKAGSFGLDRISTVPAPTMDGGTAVRVRYPAGSSSQNSHRTDGSPEGGAQIYLPLKTGGVSSLWLSYAVRFEKGFDFVRGGKLPGLYGGTMTSGGNIPDGTNGLSTRLMWRTKGAGEVYAYLPSSVTYGTQLGLGNWTFVPDEWEQVKQYVRLNDVGQKNGQILVYINGKSVLDEQHLVFRTTTSLQIAGIFFSTFFGGSDASWASPRDQYVDFADFGVSSAEPNAA